MRKSRSPLADIVPGWNKLKRGERAAITRGLYRHMDKMHALPLTDPRRLAFERKITMVEKAALAAGLRPTNEEYCAWQTARRPCREVRCTNCPLYSSGLRN